jgi:hypothetical protein
MFNRVRQEMSANQSVGGVTADEETASQQPELAGAGGLSQ